jgi:23S rRNA (cytidine2498-2'-O)-methyltransferase
MNLKIDGLLAYCRAGFEREAHAELLILGCAKDVDLAEHFFPKVVVDKSAKVPAATKPSAKKALTKAGDKASAAKSTTEALANSTDVGIGFALASLIKTGSGTAAVPQVDDCVFARQLVPCATTLILLPARDRLSVLHAAVNEFCAANGISSFSELRIEHPDTNNGRAASGFARNFHPIFSQALVDAAQLDFRPNSVNKPVLHVFLIDAQRALIGASQPGRSSVWHNGVPRLRMPAEAPSRSTLKLAEAVFTFLGDDAERMMAPDMNAVDLGAAPGGWTWHLIHRGLKVTAIDNGPLKGDLIDNAMVRHLREDGFRYRPKGEVDWLVCDMVEQPIRIANLVAQWLVRGDARHAIFNLKMPMKKRGEALQQCADAIHEQMQEAGIRYQLRFKHLYHDREEITGYLGKVSSRDAQTRDIRSYRDDRKNPNNPKNIKAREEQQAREAAEAEFRKDDGSGFRYVERDAFATKSASSARDAFMDDLEDDVEAINPFSLRPSPYAVSANSPKVRAPKPVQEVLPQRTKKPVGKPKGAYPPKKPVGRVKKSRK